VNSAVVLRPLLTLVLLVCATGALAADAPDVVPTLTARRVAQPPTIDGLLDDAAWQQPSLELGKWTSYNPLYGDVIVQQTKVWVAYDEQFLYFAFQCDDPEPQRIKTSITRRDNIWADDWVGLSLDALGSGQQAYHLMVNPSGIQLDMLNSAASGEDEAPDWIWDSAGKANEHGYAVEIRLPLQTIRFRGGDAVRMGILFWRRVSRAGISVSWPGLKPNEWVFQHHAPLMFERLAARPTREVLPSAVYTGQQTRESPVDWTGLGGGAEAGLSGKWGVLPTVTLEGTVNPDFSQVESDAFQVEINQRFPIFYPEKRPFFMEGAGLFNVAGPGGDTNLITAVHTRNIVDPIGGVKLTGTMGRWTFGTLTAFDEAPGHEVAPASPLLNDKKPYIIGRAQYSLNPSSFVGAIFTDTEFGPSHNRAGGVDLNLQFKKAHTITAMALTTATLDTDGMSREGVAARTTYSFSNQRYDFSALGEHYDTGFQMDTAFYNQTGITTGWGYTGVNFYPDKKKYPWFRRFTPFSFTQFSHDRVAGGDMLLNVTGFRSSFTRQGFFRFDKFSGYEPWANQRFDMNRWRAIAELQPYRWVYLEFFGMWGDAVFYDPVDPFQGRQVNLEAEATFQPTSRFSEALRVQRVDFDRRDNGDDVYDLWIVYSRSTYQFSRHLFVRAIAQLDTSRERVLTDFLASYELRPGTVLFAGYGSLVERRAWQDDVWRPGEGDYLTTQRGLFFKASYLYRF
jgi:Domain of unknown function (DUF5916)/Carbohydrate family 9 binding domain-like